MSWRVLIADPIHEAGPSLLARAGCEIATDGLDRLEGCDALIVRSRTRVSAEVLQSARPRLRVVGRAGVGVDNIDLRAAQANQVTVVNSPLAATEAVAEHTLALMFALARSLPAADRSMKDGQWNKKAIAGTELGGKTLGIIGVGRIGAALAQRALALQMKVVGYDLFLDDEQVRAAGAEPLTLNELLERAQFLSLHVPLTDDTRSMIGPAELERLPQGAYLISTARGGVVNERALLDALERGKLAGAGLDVFEQEPPNASVLVQHPRVVATPHIAAQTAEAQERAARDIAEEVLAALEGRDLRWRVV